MAREVVHAIRKATQSSANLIRILFLVDGNCEIDLIDLINDSDVGGICIDRVELAESALNDTNQP
jgi:hypothetical protein